MKVSLFFIKLTLMYSTDFFFFYFQFSGKCLITLC